MRHEDRVRGLWINPDGSARPARIKGGPLFDAFHGIREAGERELGTSRSDMARAYATAVWAYRCIKLRADAAAGVPLILLDRDGEPIVDHALLRLLRDVNPYTMNLGDLLRATEAAYNIWGVAYWLKVFGPGPGSNGVSGRAAVKWLVWLNPQTVEAVVDSRKGITGYKQTIGARTHIFAPEEVIAFRNFNPLDDLGGLSPLSVALDEVNAELNAARFVTSFFANEARPAGLLTTDENVHEDELERIQTWWQQLFKGVGNRWKTGVVGGGLRWQTITFPIRDLALGELRAEDRRAICAAFGVPAAMAGAWEAATYASAREQKASFYEDTVIPQLEYLAEVLNWSLLPHYPDLVARDARLAWDLDTITALRESATDRAERFAMLYRAGLLTRNEARAELGMQSVNEAEDGFIGARTDDSQAETGEIDDEAAMKETESPPAMTGVKGLTVTPGDVVIELKRWRRFAANRIKLGQKPRRYHSAAIPEEIREEIEAGLAQADSLQDALAVFDKARRRHRAIIRPSFDRSSDRVEESDAGRRAA